MFKLTIILLLLISPALCIAQKHAANKPFNVIAYYTGGPYTADSFEIGKLTHIIFSFCHLKGNRLNVSNSSDTTTIQKLVALKQSNPQLKVMLSLGGWGGCASCSDVFNSKDGRKEFAASVKEILDYFSADGIDLDWEYPTIAGYPGHVFRLEDKDNFTDLIRRLRRTLGRNREVSFAAGGFRQYILESVDWKKISKKVDRINLMTYDLVGGYATVSGHHTALYSSSQQTESVDNAIRLLDSLEVPLNKLVVGAAFYARVFEVSDSLNNGLYRPAKFKRGISYHSFPEQLSTDSGYRYYFDSSTSAPYYFHPEQKLLVTMDDSISVRLKTEYAIRKKLNGIMFWQLRDDSFRNGLLDAIDEAREKYPVANEKKLNPVNN